MHSAFTVYSPGGVPGGTVRLPVQFDPVIVKVPVSSGVPDGAVLPVMVPAYSPKSTESPKQLPLRSTDDPACTEGGLTVS